MSSGKAAARDTRHGRRGGGWIEEGPATPRTEKKNTEWIDHECPVCYEEFRGSEDAKHCGRVLCTAMLEWDDDRWMGQARMADARQALADAKYHGSTRLAGMDELDREALRRREERR